MDVNDSIKRAYGEFKGGRHGDASIPDARSVLDVVSTARTYRWNGVDVVAACFKSGCGPVTETDAIVERHGLAEVGRELGGGLVIYYAREGEVEAAREGASDLVELPPAANQ